MVRFLLSVAVSALSFWIDDVAGVYFTVQLAASVLSGRLIPLHLLGAEVESVLTLTPFYYLTFAPATLLAGEHPCASGPPGPVAVGGSAAGRRVDAHPIGPAQRYTNVAA